MMKFGLIGYPISKSMSPALFSAGYGGKYRYDLIEGQDFGSSFNRFIEEYEGINVTAPFKQDAFAVADSRSEACRKIGAANLLVKDGKGIRAYNTDYSGIILSVADALMPEGGYGYYSRYGEDWTELRKAVSSRFGQRPKALVAGCGGAGRAACVAAADMGFSTVIMNRTMEKALKTASEIPEYGFRVAGIQDFAKELKDCDLLVHTIPERIPELDSLTPGTFSGNENGKIILEANYKSPSFSGRLADMAAGCWCRYVSGRRWLLYQALTGYSLFTGEKPDFRKMDEVL